MKTLTAKRINGTTEFYDNEWNLVSIIPQSRRQPRRDKKTHIHNGQKYNLIWQ